MPQARREVRWKAHAIQYLCIVCPSRCSTCANAYATYRKPLGTKEPITETSAVQTNRGRHAKPHHAQPSRGRIALRWFLVVAMAAFIFYMSSRTAGQLGGGIVGQIKQMLNAWINATIGTTGDPMSVVAHFSEYLVLGALLVNALSSHMSVPRAFLLAIACASAYGVTDEIHQIFVEGRYCDVRDWLTDTLGASLGSALAWIAVRMRA